MSVKKVENTGNLSDLDPHIHMFEFVVTTGSGITQDGWFRPSDPPFAGGNDGSNWLIPNPRDQRNAPETMRPGSQGGLGDFHSAGGRFNVPLFGNGAFAIQGLQTWNFRCDDCGTEQIVPSVTGESGVNTIIRMFFPLTANTCNPFSRIWRYKTYKHDFSAWEDWRRGLFGSYRIGDSKWGPLP